MARGRLVALATGLVMLVCAAPAAAATITVNTTNDDQSPGDGQCSLRKAIQDVDSPGSTQHDCAPAAFGANVIVLGKGTYLLGFASQLSIVSTVTNLTIAGAGEGQTAIDARLLQNRVFDIASGATVVIRDLTIANGHAPDGEIAKPAQGLPGDAGDNGGGIFNQGTLTLVDSELTGNRAGAGGSGSGDVTGHGGAGGPGGSGGGIYNTGTLTLDGVTLSDNQAGGGAPGGSGGQGGGSEAGGPGGAGGEGGGVMNAGGTLTVMDSTLRSNTAGNGGSGGLGGSDAVATGAGGGAGGSGGGGGGIESDGGSLSVNNSTFASNSAGAGGQGGNGGAAPASGGVGGAGGTGGAGGAGGAVRVVGTSAATLLQTTSAGNNVGAGGTGGSGATPGVAGGAGSGGGVIAQGSSLTLENSLLALDGGGNCGSGTLDGGHNLSFGDSSCPAAFASGDPNLGPLQDNGGPAPTIGLQPGSAAIDQIPATGAGCPATDERGVLRPSESRCDIGAYEVAPPVVSTLPASRVTRNDAQLNASVTADAGSAFVSFQYGRTTRYGSSAYVLHASGVTPVTLTWRLAGLEPNTTYHYRAVVTSQDGASYGADRTLVTTVAVLKHLSISPASFGDSGRAMVTYTDSARASTTFVVLGCSARKGRCVRYSPVARFTHHDRQGSNRLELTTRVGRRRLSPGRYLLDATPLLAGNPGTTSVMRFRVT